MIKKVLSTECRRAETYKFLSVCYHMPDEKLIKMLNGLEKSEVELHSEIAGKVPGVDEVELLKIDYSKLFVGPYKMHAPPYGSVYLEDGRRVMGCSTMDVRNRYRAEGLEIAVKDAPDHISVELEFMHFLILEEIEAVKNSVSEKVAYYLEKQRSFLETHLTRWLFIFTDAIEANAKTKFYKSLGRLTKAFIKKDLKSLSGGGKIVGKSI